MNLMKLGLLGAAGLAVTALLGVAAWGCEEPKHPVPCTGDERWPDPCAAAPARDGGMR